MITPPGGLARSPGAGSQAEPSPAGGSVMSVRTRLLLWLVLPLLQVILVAAVLDYRAVDRTVDEAFDRVLLNSAVAIGESVREGQIPGTLRLPVDRLRVLLNDSVDALDYRVVGPRGEHLAGNPALALPADDADPSFYDLTLEGRELRAVRIAADTDAGNLSVVVAETQRKRRKLLEQLRSSLLIEDAIMLGLTIAVCLLAIRMALAPLSRLAAQLSRREPGDLTPLGPQAAPAEVRPLTAALDTLFGRLAEGRDAQRRFVENAAHQLRTPLAGLKGQIELALGEARRLRDRPPVDDTEAAQALANRLASAQGAADRLTRLSHQLLTLSRADQSTRDASGGQVVAIADLIDEVIALHIDAALARGQDLGAETEPLEVPGSAWQLRELLSNLVDNAIRYTPAGGRITVRCGRRDGRDYAEVEDNGAGIPAPERRLVFERFWRASSATGQGSGLGLAIVREIAQSHGAQVSVEDPPGGRGTVVRVSFPPRAGTGAARGSPALRSGSDAPGAGT